MKHVYDYLKPASVLVALLAMFAAVSCEDEPDRFELADGLPEVSYIRPVSAESADSLLTGAYMDNMICIVGNNLRSIYELWFNDRKAVLNTSYITDNTLIVNVPGVIPSVVSDKIYMVTAARDTVTYDFSVLVPGPVMTSMSCEQVPAGGEAVIYGDYFIDDPNVPLTVTFSGDVKAKEIKSITKTAITLVVPEGAQEGAVTVETIYGTAKSTFHYLDSRGMMFEFDGLTGLENHGWHNRTISDEGGLTGKYVQLGDGTTVMSEDGGWNDSQFAFEYWCGSWDNPQNMTSGNGMALHNLVDFTDYGNMALKFEMCVPKDTPWSAGAMQIAFAGYDKVTYSGNPVEGYDGAVASANAYIFNGEDGKNGSWGRALYRPWLSADGGVFHTDDKWITVTVPMSDFKYDRLGSVTDNLFTSEIDFSSLTIFVVGGGVNGTECTPVIKIDNIRAVPNR